MKRILSFLMAALVVSTLADAAKKPAWKPVGDKIKTR